ncbi:MAG: type IV-A pilus assembly ATPase PilB [Xanthomonadales bacterium]|jgi:type IV pilus assembly protein PilB|nr:type IV-A pilus assembly ATPase PilB [Xanthomonadales bacterium]
MYSESPVMARLTGLARRLVDEGLLTQEVALQAAEEASEKKRSLVSHLSASNKVPAGELARLTAAEFGFPLIDLAAFDLRDAPTKSVKEELIRKHHALPVFQRGNILYLAMADPTNHSSLDEIAFNANLHIEPLVAPTDQIEPAIERALEDNADAMSDLAGEEGLDELGFENNEEDDKQEEVANEADEKPVVRFVNKVLVDAIRRGASDIHFEPYEYEYRIRFRMDGVLKSVLKPPSKMAPRLSARLKVMSGMDIAERRVPQDGRIKLNLSKTKAIDFRVNTCPTLFGEKIVLRVLDASAAKIGVDMLGFEAEQKQLFVDAIAKPYGMILVTGPTGSGKTVTLYTALNMLNDEGRNISTAEDPVEIRVPGINQVQQNTKQGLTFALALRAFLRQDPDIIMVGEIRDLETAEIAIKAAQTGHLVLSTLHTNDAPQSITRMVNMGVPSYNITSSVHLVIAQRLARRLHECKMPDDIPHDALKGFGFTDEELSDEEFTIFKPGGCSSCNEGYKGRVGIYQVMPLSEDMERIVLAGGTSLDLADQSLKEGINDLRRSALNKVKAGITSIVEINRVTKD